MLSAAGIASIHFAPTVTQGSLARLVKGFPTNTNAKASQVAEQLKEAMQGDASIHVNEVCFVPADSAVAKSTVAAQIAARTIGMNSEQQEALFSSPERLLQLIVAAEGNKTRGNGAPPNYGDAEAGNSPSDISLGLAAEVDGGADAAGPGTPGEPENEKPLSRWKSASMGIRRNRPAPSQTGSLAVETGLITLQEDELQGLLQALAQMAKSTDAKDRLDPQSFQSRLSTLPRRARFTLSQALSALAAQAPTETSDRPTLLKLAEHIAVRFALDSYQRGDTQVDTVRQMLEEMSVELDGLRKTVGVYEEKMTQAGIELPSYIDILAQQFWANIPDEKQQATLEGEDAWCVPPVKARECIEKLVDKGDTETADRILRNYVNGITRESAEVRRQTAAGIVELAPLLASRDEKFFIDTIRQIGAQLAAETDSELQSLVGAAFVRLGQEATSRRSFRAIQDTVEVTDFIESERPGVGKNLRPRISIDDHLTEFIDEALRSGDIPGGLKDLLRHLPEAASEHIAKRFGRVSFREDCQILASMMEAVGPDGLEHLRRQLDSPVDHVATDAVGILTRVDIETVKRVLPVRLKEWKRTAHDRVVRQIAASGSSYRGRLLAELFGYLDPLIRPLAIDEIGMCGERSPESLLSRLAGGDLPKDATPYLRLKAVEALGRLRIGGSEAILRKIAESRKTWRWAFPSELRLVAVQALQKINPDWASAFISRSGLQQADLSIQILESDPNSSAIRQRRYPRLRLENPVWAMTTNLRENCRVEIPEMALGGGVGVCEQILYPGSIVELRLNPSQKSVKAQTIVRDANTQARAFEVVDIELEERSKLRKLLVQIGSAQKQSTPRERSRGPRTIVTNSA